MTDDDDLMPAERDAKERAFAFLGHKVRYWRRLDSEAAYFMSDMTSQHVELMVEGIVEGIEVRFDRGTVTALLFITGFGRVNMDDPGLTDLGRHLYDVEVIADEAQSRRMISESASGGPGANVSFTS